MSNEKTMRDLREAIKHELDVVRADLYHKSLRFNGLSWTVVESVFKQHKATMGIVLKDAKLVRENAVKWVDLLEEHLKKLHDEPETKHTLNITTVNSMVGILKTTINKSIV